MFAPHPAVKELPTLLVDEIYAKYISGEKIKVLIKDYDLDVSVSQFFKIFPPVYDGDATCRYCGQRMYFFRPSKSSYGTSHLQRSCQCGHCEWRSEARVSSPLRCDCAECRKAALALSEEKEKERLAADILFRRKLLSTHSFRTPVRFSSLSLKEVAALFALLNYWAAEDLSMIQPLSREIGFPYTANADVSTELLRLLYQNRVIEVDAQNSSLDAFSREDHGPFFLYRVCWQPNIDIRGDGIRCPLNELWPWLLNFFSHGGWEEKWSTEILELWMDLGVEECVQYLEMRLGTTKNLEFSAEEKTRAEFRLLLEEYSVSQIYNFCLIAVKDAASFLEHETCKGAKHASNTIPGKLKSIAAHYKAKEREIPSYHREARCPQSALSRALFHSILCLDGDVGFKCSPLIYWEEQLKTRLQASNSRREENYAGGKHYLMCLDCLSPEVNLRFNSQHQIEMVCPDCGERTLWSQSLN